MGGGQRINKVQLGSFHKIPWDDERLGFERGALGHFAEAVVKPDEFVLRFWDENTRTVTYYKLPSIIQRIAKCAFEQGQDANRSELKKMLGL